MLRSNRTPTEQATRSAEQLNSVRSINSMTETPREQGTTRSAEQQQK